MVSDPSDSISLAAYFDPAARRMMNEQLSDVIEETKWYLKRDACEQDDDLRFGDAYRAELRAECDACRRELAFRERHGLEHRRNLHGIDPKVIEELKRRRPVEVEVGLTVDLRRSGDSHRGVYPPLWSIKRFDAHRVAEIVSLALLAMWPRR